MAWSSISTPTAGTVISTTTFGALVSGNLAVLGGSWTTDARATSAVWQATSTNPVIGNGTFTSRYMNAGKLFIWNVHILSGSTTTYGTGTWQLVAPFTLQASTDAIMQGFYDDASTGDNYPIWFQGINTTTLNGRALVATGATAAVKFSVINASTPITAANGDAWTLQGIFELA